MGSGASASASASASNPRSNAKLNLDDAIEIGSDLVSSHNYTQLRRFLGQEGKGLSQADKTRIASKLLELSSESGHLDCMELLISHLRIKDNDEINNTSRSKTKSKSKSKSQLPKYVNVEGYPLHVAASNFQVDAIEILLISNLCSAADLDSFGQNALHRCCSASPSVQEEVSAQELTVSILLHSMKGQSKDSVNSQDLNGNTPLHLACKVGNISLSSFLLGLGAKLSLRNNKFKSPIDMAAINNHIELSTSLKSGRIGFLGQKKAKKKRGEKERIDVEKAMAIWECFFVNSMKRNAGGVGGRVASVDDFDVRERSAGEGTLSWTPRRDDYNHEYGSNNNVDRRKYRLEIARKREEERGEKDYLLALKKEKAKAKLRREGNDSGAVERGLGKRKDYVKVYESSVRFDDVDEDQDDPKPNKKNRNKNNDKNNEEKEDVQFETRQAMASRFSKGSPNKSPDKKEEEKEEAKEAKPETNETNSELNSEAEVTGEDIFWTRIHDAEYDRAYYFNNETEQSEWSRPEEGRVSDYIVMFDDIENRDFYFYDETGESLWTIKADSKADGERVIAGSQDERVGKIFSSSNNNSEVESEAEKEYEYESSEAAEEYGGIQRAEHLTYENPTLNPDSWLGWMVTYDENVKKEVYFNTHTLETTSAPPSTPLLLCFDEASGLYYITFETGDSRWSLGEWKGVAEGDVFYYWNWRTGETKWELSVDDVD
ncbi:hypothetical protein TrVE_jg2709 [Triparma verrucosa]|uniref:WW domain-containing protein n=1 Tax=Triparma verrucosa TaxID=1606542 RepID=A0A9W7KWD0_9STRA|nr:hypothetical protein TrVE_jg2709 [Triparma verrucosa]